MKKVREKLGLLAKSQGNVCRKVRINPVTKHAQVRGGSIRSFSQNFNVLQEH